MYIWLLLEIHTMAHIAPPRIVHIVSSVYKTLELVDPGPSATSKEGLLEDGSTG